MKRLTLLAISTLLFAPLAMASKARLGALGQDTDGSYFIKDHRSIFLNPAAIVGMKQQMNIEWGNNSGATPKAEGGLVHSADFGTIGLHLGRLGMGAQNILAAETDVSMTVFNPQNSIELTYGRKSRGLNIGGSLHYANSESNTGETANLPDSDASIVTVTVGAMTDIWEGYLAYGMTESAQTEAVGNATDEYTGKTSVKTGGAYSFSDDLKVSLQFMLLDFGFDDGAGLTGDRSKQEIAVNFYNKIAGSDTLFVYYTAGITSGSQSIDYDPSGATDIETNQTYLPIVIGAEAKVKDWLTLRGSIKQNTLIDSARSIDGSGNKVDTKGIDNTTVAAGMGMSFGDVTIDGIFAGSNSTGNLDANELMANVAVKYTY